MRKILKFSFLMTVVAAAASFANFTKEAKPTQASDINRSFDYTVKELLTNIYNNDLEDVTCNESFDYGARHGHLNTGTSPAVGMFTTKGENVGDMSSGAGATSDWAGARLTSLNDDRFIFKFVAKTPITVTVTCGTPAGWVEASHVACYIVNKDVYSESVPNWLNNGEEKKSVSSPSSSTDFAFTTSLNIGEVLYYQWGFQWDGDSRTFQTEDSGLKFSISCNIETFTMKEMLSELSSGTVASFDRKPYSVGAFHGSMDGDSPSMKRLSKTESPNAGELSSATGAASSDWAGARLNSLNGDYFMIRFYSRSYVRIVWSATSFAGGIDGSQLKVYKCGVDFDDDPDDCDDFSIYESCNLSDGEVSDACGGCSIAPGESLVWAWGSEDTDWARNWQTENSEVTFQVRSEAYEKLQEEVNATKVVTTLAYTYTVNAGTYSDVSFKVGVGFSFLNLQLLEFSRLSMLGIQFRADNENMKDDVETVLFNVYSLEDCIFEDDDNGVIYTILDFGDALNNPSRLTDVFKLNFFVKFGDFVIASRKTKTTSIYAMVDQYVDMEEPVEGLKNIIDTLVVDE